MSKIPSLFNDNAENPVTLDNAFIRWCIERCGRCGSIFTVTILMDDILVARKCMSCDHYEFLAKDE